jgi:hypothetical protein
LDALQHVLGQVACGLLVDVVADDKVVVCGDASVVVVFCVLDFSRALLIVVYF